LSTDALLLCFNSADDLLLTIVGRLLSCSSETFSTGVLLGDDSTDDDSTDDDSIDDLLLIGRLRECSDVPSNSTDDLLLISGGRLFWRSCGTLSTDALLLCFNSADDFLTNAGRLFCCSSVTFSTGDLLLGGESTDDDSTDDDSIDDLLLIGRLLGRSSGLRGRSSDTLLIDARRNDSTDDALLTGRLF